MSNQGKILDKIGGKIPRSCAMIHTSIAEDYVKMELRMSSIEKKVAGIEKNMATKKDLDQLKHTLLPLSQKASKWELLQMLSKSKIFWFFIILFISAVAFAGQRLAEIIFKFTI